MKKTFTLLLVLVLGCITVKAVPAYPFKQTVTLSDGSKVELTLCGDEHYKFYTGSDGYAYRKINDKYERLAFAQAHSEWKNKMTSANNERRARTRRVGKPVQNLTGKKKGLVILMQFADYEFVLDDPQKKFYDCFNKEGFSDYGMAGSVTDYFKAQSYGQFELDFDVVGPFTAKHSMVYYGAPDPDKNSDDSHVPQLVKEACEFADSLVDYNDYDWDGDKQLDQVFVIYAGYSEAQGASENTIWPHEWSLAGESLRLTCDGVKINTYACGSELSGTETNTKIEMAGIGTACHEFSHCLGLPDFYDTGDGTNYGMGTWDVMCQGAYNGGYGSVPSAFTSYERMFAGWLTPTELSGDMTRISGMKALTDAPEAYILYNEANRNEYYLLENRQLKGFDAAQYGHGLLVLHVDYDEGVWGSNKVNTNPNRQRLTIIPADGVLSARTVRELAGDPFPGRSNNTMLTNNSTPAAITYNANADGSYFMNKPIDNITESEDGLISFVALRPELPIPNIDESVAEEGDVDGSFTISWPAVSGATGYELELTQMGVAPSDPKEALVYEYNFEKTVTASLGFTDISNKLDNYGLSGWTGEGLYTSPDKLRIGTSKSNGTVRTETWRTPQSSDVTIVMGESMVKGVNKVEGSLRVAYGNAGDNATYESANFEFTEDGQLVFNFNIRKDLFWIDIYPEARMNLNYLAIYDGEWTAEQLGIADAPKASVARRASVTNYTTDTNSITLTGLYTDCRYVYRVRSIGVEGTVSLWSDEKSFKFGTSGISSVILNDNAVSQGIYDLNGRYMGTDVNNLRRGVYIRGGKKIVK